MLRDSQEAPRPPRRHEPDRDPTHEPARPDPRPGSGGPSSRSSRGSCKRPPPEWLVRWRIRYRDKRPVRRRARGLGLPLLLRPTRRAVDGPLADGLPLSHESDAFLAAARAGDVCHGHGSGRPVAYPLGELVHVEHHNARERPSRCPAGSARTRRARPGPPAAKSRPCGARPVRERAPPQPPPAGVPRPARTARSEGAWTLPADRGRCRFPARPRSQPRRAPGRPRGEGTPGGFGAGHPAVWPWGSRARLSGRAPSCPASRCARGRARRRQAPCAGTLRLSSSSLDRGRCGR